MSKRPYLPCREILAFLDDYVAGALASEVMFEFERHLAVCPSCVAYLASYRETIAMTTASATAPMLAIEEPPEDLVKAIVASIAAG